MISRSRGAFAEDDQCPANSRRALGARIVRLAAAARSLRLRRRPAADDRVGERPSHKPAPLVRPYNGSTRLLKSTRQEARWRPTSDRPGRFASARSGTVGAPLQTFSGAPGLCDGLRRTRSPRDPRCGDRSRGKRSPATTGASPDRTTPVSPNSIVSAANSGRVMRSSAVASRAAGEGRLHTGRGCRRSACDGLGRSRACTGRIPACGLAFPASGDLRVSRRTRGLALHLCSRVPRLRGMIAGSYNPRLCDGSARGLCETISAQTSVDPGMRTGLRGCGSDVRRRRACRG